jgi:tetratricopeptide (TPR) repeat protein
MRGVTTAFSRTEITTQVEDIVIGDRYFRAVVEKGELFIVEYYQGEQKKYLIQHALGGKNIYYFMTPTEGGRQQVLPLGYDVRRKEWFNTTASMIRHFNDQTDEALDWRDRALTFNTSCHSCHVSQLSTNYDLGTDTYHTIWAEPGINCETCHGPCAEHIEVCSNASAGETPADLKIVMTTRFNPEQINALCAPCHAKMTPLTDDVKPGDPFFDQYDLVTLEDTDFYPDGRDLGENFTYTLWRMSPCAKSGELDCIHCHTSSGRYRFAGENANGACLPCHETNVENAAAHSHHQAGSEGSRCISCHMPKTEFARMIRSDHSMRPPVPAASITYGSPNACNICHEDQEPGWADRWVRKWRQRDYQRPMLHSAALVSAARKAEWQRLPEMLSYILDPDHDEIVTTSLIRLLADCEDDSKWPVLLEELKDPSPLIRSAAAAGLQFCHTERARDALLTVVDDTFRVVRLRAAMSLASFPREMTDQVPQAKLRRTFKEYETSQQTRLDDWSSHYNLGNFYFNLGDLQQALISFERANKLRPESIVPLVNMSLAYNLAGRNAEAERSLRYALTIEPRNGMVNLNLGLLMAEMGRTGEAEHALRTAVEADPYSAVAAYNLGILVAQEHLEEGAILCGKAFALRPQEARYGYTYAFYLNRSGDHRRAIDVLAETIGREPAFADAHLLLGSIHETLGEREKAREVYRLAIENEQIPAHDRLRIAARLRTL